MAYEFRKVKCPWCDHIFMWSDSTREGLVFHLSLVELERKLSSNTFGK